MLSARTVAAAARAGIDIDADKFRPHITLARARSKHDLPELVAALESPQPRAWNVTSFTLIRSHLGADPRYEPLAVFPLSTTTLHA
jgi:2'-5' RNA ligase